MTTTAQASGTDRPAGSDRDAGWRDIAALVLARVGARLRLIASAVRPLAWVLGGIALACLVIALPLGWMGSMAHRLIVRRDLDAIFDFRAHVVGELLNGRH